MFQHGEGREGIRSEIPVLPAGKNCRFYSPTRDLTGPAKKTREGRCILPQHQSGTPTFPIPDGLFIKSYERELLSSSPFSHPRQVCVMIYFRITLLQLHGGKIHLKVHQRCFFTGLLSRIIRAAPGPYQ